jgi:hypothetical protein
MEGSQRICIFPKVLFLQPVRYHGCASTNRLPTISSFVVVGNVSSVLVLLERPFHNSGIFGDGTVQVKQFLIRLQLTNGERRESTSSRN